jgi:hypothetical protein
LQLGNDAGWRGAAHRPNPRGHRIEIKTAQTRRSASRAHIELRCITTRSTGAGTDKRASDRAPPSGATPSSRSIS